jgi:hypothetical protein
MIDEQIRDLLAEGLAPEVRPLSADEVQARAGAMSNGVSRTHRAFLIAACVACLAALGGGLVALRSGAVDDLVGAPPSVSPIVDPSAGVEVGRYFVPSTLPDRFELLGVDASAAQPTSVAGGAAVYVDGAGGRVSLRVASSDGRWSTSDNTDIIEGGIVRWTRFETLAGAPVLGFQIDRNGALIDGEATGIDGIDTTALFESVGVDETSGVPQVTDPAYTLRSSRAPGEEQLLAALTTYYGPPGGYVGAAGIEVRVERYAEPIDTELMAGAWSNRIDANGRTIMLGPFDASPWWTPAPDTIVRVQASGDLTSADLLANLQEVDKANLQAAVDQIATTADTLIPTETLTFRSGAILDLYGPEHDPRGLCLTSSGQRRCDLALMRRNSYTNDDQVIGTAIELLVGQRWYTVGLTQHDSDLNPNTETAVGASGTWYLVHNEPTP